MTTRITTDNITDATIGTADIASSVPLNTQWQAVKTNDFTAVAGEGYFVDTTSAAVEVTLPASPSAGDTVVLKDYARTWNTNNVTTASALFDGVSIPNTFSTNGQTVTLVYMDDTKGWSLVNEDTTTDLSITYTTATGGTITESGDYKIHTFTGDGCFVVSQVGTGGNPAVVDYLVLAGGGGGSVGEAGDGGAGGGAGGYRESSGTASGCYSASPLGSGVDGITVTSTTYPITVGAGGSGMLGTRNQSSTSGSPSIFSTITSAGGGGASGTNTPSSDGENGGSGGGGSGGGPGGPGSGNTPPTSPPQGNDGGFQSANIPSPANWHGGGGGGAGASGENATSTNGGAGGNGVSSSITGSSVTRAGGGGASIVPGRSPVGSNRPGGTGGGGPASPSQATASSPANSGGGGGAVGGFNHPDPAAQGGHGGKGIVIIRYKFQN